MANLLRDQIVGDARQPLLILFGAVALVLLIACLNAANLLVARANTRGREFVVRRAIGAGRGRSSASSWSRASSSRRGGCAGTRVAAVVLRLLAAQRPHGFVVGIDGTVLAFTSLLAVVTGLGFGVVPALRASAPSLDSHCATALAGPSPAAPPHTRRARRQRGRAGAGPSRRFGAARSELRRRQRGQPGLRPTGASRGPDSSHAGTVFQSEPEAHLLQRSPPASSNAARRQRGHLRDGLPLAGVVMVEMNPQGIRPDDPDSFLKIAALAVGPDFFSTMRIPILQGRAFTADDGREQAPPVCVVSEALAHRLWPNRNPIGQNGMGWSGDATVVGVVGDVRTESLEGESGPAVFTLAARTDRSRDYDEIWVVVRSAHPLRVVPELRGMVRAEDATQPIAENHDLRRGDSAALRESSSCHGAHHPLRRPRARAGRHRHRGGDGVRRLAADDGVWHPDCRRRARDRRTRPPVERERRARGDRPGLGLGAALAQRARCGRCCTASRSPIQSRLAERPSPSGSSHWSRPTCRLGRAGRVNPVEALRQE